MLGVLGGMGPLATVDFMQKVIVMSRAGSDQEHIPMLVHNVPQVPDRSASILHGAEDPFPAMLAGLKKLEDSGVACVVIPCNTAHFWLEQLEQHARVPIISILDCVAREIRDRGLQKIGLMATDATVAADIYMKRIENDGRACLLPSDSDQVQLMQGIYAIKSHDLETGCNKMEKVFRQLTHEGAEAVILGCTEIPIGLERVIAEKPDQCIDATALLAKACIDWYYSENVIAA